MGKLAVKHWFQLLTVLVTLYASCNGLDKQEKIVNSGANNGTEPRLGLLATQLGLAAVPGYEVDGGVAPLNVPSQDYLPTGGAPIPPPPPPATGYSIEGEGGIQGGNLISPSQCQCVPVEHCPSYNGGGGQQGGNVPPYGGDGLQGGNVSPYPGEGQHGGNGQPYPGEGQQGGNGQPYPGEGQQGGNIPVIGGSGGQHGGNVPIISGGEGLYGLGGGQHGGNIPVVGGGGGGGGGGDSHGGNIPISTGGGDPGYGGEGNAGHAPNTDGAGLLDLRIVNRPPGTGGVQCLNGHVFCCDAGKPSTPISSKPNYPKPGAGGSGGYAICGARNYIDVPGRSLEYGDAKFGAYPWMAVILGKGNNYVGAGALVSPLYVLTAAHKIKSWKPGAAMKVRLGEWNAKEDDEPYKNVEIEIESVTIHPGFNPQNLQNDVALVRLSHPVDIQSHPHIASVCLPQKSYQYTGQRCWVAGFGKDAFGNGKHSYIMKEVDLPIMDSNECEQRLRTTRLGNYFQLNRYSFLCAGGEEGKDACTGDGGSPLVCETGKGGTWEVVGLVAWGIGCADYGIPGAYVNVPNYVDWINEEIYRY